MDGGTEGSLEIPQRSWHTNLGAILGKSLSTLLRPGFLHRPRGFQADGSWGPRSGCAEGTRSDRITNIHLVLTLPSHLWAQCSAQQLSDVDTIIIFLLQARELRHRLENFPELSQPRSDSLGLRLGNQTSESCGLIIVHGEEIRKEKGTKH